MLTYKQNSLVDILRWRSKHQPNRMAYRFLSDGESEAIVWSYEDLDVRACSIAAMLQSCTSAGDRAVLLFPPGLEFIAAYFGCLYAGVVAIPVHPPHPARLEKTLPVIRRIAEDAKPSVALLTTSLLHGFTLRKIELPGIKLLATDNAELFSNTNTRQLPDIKANDIAFLQYTSGSTTLPKGVMVSHSNLVDNLGLIEESFGLCEQSKTVFWLPPYHDMGLIGGILQSLYTGYPVTLIPHLLFLQKPVRWLQAISSFRATCSGGPNFAYELCVKKITPEKREQIDLSSWEVAFNGAEPVYRKTLEQFASYFACCGFRREAFLPCYGLAEATLMVVGGPKGRKPVVQHLMSSALEQNQVIVSPSEKEGYRTLVSCGQKRLNQQISIVNIETMAPCSNNQVGEIWVSGPSVAYGYWNKPADEAMTFSASLPGVSEMPYLRTGDLGFISDGELYITGRLKDLIICDGSNHYPHDIERTVEGCHSAILSAGCAAFSICDEITASEKLVIVAEVDYRQNINEADITTAIRNAVSCSHDLHIYDIKLTTAGRIPRTTSGKIKRYLCKTNYLSNSEITST